jgi:bleomycin hydrolase
MIRYSLALIFVLFFDGVVCAQAARTELAPIKEIPHTPVKNQANSGTCWSFSMLSLVESQAIKAGIGEFDLSEMFVVRNIYIDKARNYILRQGAAQFGPGGLGHDVLKAVSDYGIVPESVYSGLTLGAKAHDHGKLDKKLKSYLDSLLEKRPLPANWLSGFEIILNDYIGKPPETFTYKEKIYTPRSFAKEVLKFKADDYVKITSFTHFPFYQSAVLQIPDNYANEEYYNLPLDEMIKVVDESITKGFSVMWDGDISNPNFRHKDGFAMQWKEMPLSTSIDPDAEETMYDQLIRQQLFENLTTQDDHLMHIVGLEKTTGGKKFYLVKNSWGAGSAAKGYIKISEAYFAINTITLIVPKAALPSSVRSRLGILK